MVKVKTKDRRVCPALAKIARTLALDFAGNQAAFAKAVRVSGSAVSRWINEGRVPRGAALARLHRDYGIAPEEWLTTGDAAQ